MNMGVLWEIVQTGLLYGQKRNTDSLEDRVEALENQLQMTQNTLRTLVRKLEEMRGEDIDQDGRIG
jgi:chaperonin cofactor prefoldin